MASTDIEYKPDPLKKSAAREKMDGISNFIYNKEGGQVFGRTGKSWAKIGLFYFVFYACLAAFFAAFLAGLLSLMDDRFPNQTGMNSLIKGNPGMGFRPQLDTEKTLVHFIQGNNTDEFSDLTESIDNYLKGFDEDKVRKEAKKKGGDVVDCRNNSRDEKTEACLVHVDDLGTECTKANHFGYGEGTPCVLLKINKVYNWSPELYQNISEVPEHLRENWAPGYLTVTCEGENDPDKDLIGEVDFFPKHGFPVDNYFPYLNQPGYRQPVVFAKFKHAENAALIQVWCKIWAKNIYHDKNDKAGSTHFELLID